MVSSRGIKYKEKNFPSVAALARHLDVTRACLSERIKRGLSEEQWGEKTNFSNKEINYKDKSFTSINELAIFLGISNGTLRARIKNGLPQEEWASKLRDFKISYKGETYSSIKSLAKKLNIKYSLLKVRIARGWHEDKWTAPRNAFAKKNTPPIHYKPVKYKGKEYKTIAELARYLDVSTQTLASRIKRKWPEARWDESYEPRKKGITYGGKKYETIKELSKKLGLNSALLSHRIRNGWPEDRWDEKNKSPKNIKYNERFFKNSKELCDHLNIKNSRKRVVLNNRLKKGYSVTEAISYLKNEYKTWSKKVIKFKGKDYESITQLAKVLGVNAATLRERIEKKLPQDEWDKKPKPRSPRKVFYEGNEYDSINELAKTLGVTHATLLSRINRNLPEKEWGKIINNGDISTGYTWEEAPKHLKEASEKLAIGLNISPVEAYKILLEKLFKNKRK